MQGIVNRKCSDNATVETETETNQRTRKAAKWRNANMHVRACSLRDRAQTESMNGVKINILCTNKKKSEYG